METITKQRIIGISVLGIIVAICLPFLFYHPISGVRMPYLSAKIPNPPSLTTYEYEVSLKNSTAGHFETAFKGQTERPEVEARALNIPAITAQLLKINHNLIKVPENQCVASCTAIGNRTSEPVAENKKNSAPSENKLSLSSDLTTAED